MSNAFLKLNKTIGHHVSTFGAQYDVFSIFGLINYPVFYVIFAFIFGVERNVENLTLRLVATVLCLGLLLRDKFPENIKQWLPIYWYITLTYCLPFFFTLMLLHNPNSNVWVMTFTSIIFWLVLLVDLGSAFILLFVGIASAISIFSINNDISFLGSYFYNIAPEYIGCLVVSAIFANNKKRLEQSKLQTAETIGASIAHELRTPLSSIVRGIEGAKKYFPILLSNYQITKKNNLQGIQFIPPRHFEILATLFDDLQREAYFSNVFIDILLYNVNQNAIKKSNLEKQEINTCIHEALQRYPFFDMQEGLVTWDDSNNFVFMGTKLLIIHVLFNLLKNALYQIEKAQKGQIQIWQTIEEDYNILHFRDTATGISPEIKNRLFQRFISDKTNGTGLGLAFCSMVMQELGGNIKCESIQREFTEFLLYFPKIYSDLS